MKKFWRNTPIPLRLARWSKRAENGCLEWVGGRIKIGPSGRGGYGVLNINKRKFTAHRVAWEMERGPVPPGMIVCHKCDNRACIDVAHLFLGTYKDNTQDMLRKKRDRHSRAASPTTDTQG